MRTRTLEPFASTSHKKALSPSDLHPINFAASTAFFCSAICSSTKAPFPAIARSCCSDCFSIAARTSLSLGEPPQAANKAEAQSATAIRQ